MNILKVLVTVNFLPHKKIYVCRKIFLMDFLNNKKKE